MLKCSSSSISPAMLKTCSSPLLLAGAVSISKCEKPEGWIPLVGDFPPPQGINVAWDTLFTEVALKLVAVIEVVKGVVSIKLAHVLVVLAATMACEYLVRVAALVLVEKLHYDRLGRYDPIFFRD